MAETNHIDLTKAKEAITAACMSNAMVRVPSLRLAGTRTVNLRDLAVALQNDGCWVVFASYDVEHVYGSHPGSHTAAMGVVRCVLTPEGAPFHVACFKRLS